MMKRWMLALLVLAMALGTAGACNPYPPYWQSPKVTSVVVSDDPVEAGSSFTVATSVTDDNVVRELDVLFFSSGPDQLGEERLIPCESPDFDPQPAVSLEFTCTMPTFASNGTWTVHVRAWDGEAMPAEGGGYGWGHTTFQVTGGTADEQAPLVESMSTAPDPVHAGTPFTVTLRLSDEHLQDYGLDEFLTLTSNTSHQTCPASSSVRVSPTLHEFVFSCPARVAGEYLAIGEFRDAIGNLRQARLVFDVLPAP